MSPWIDEKDPSKKKDKNGIFQKQTLAKSTWIKDMDRYLHACKLMLQNY